MKFQPGMVIGDLVVVEERAIDVELVCKCSKKVLRKKTSLVAYITSSTARMCQTPKCKTCAKGDRRIRGTSRESLAKAAAKNT